MPSMRDLCDIGIVLLRLGISTRRAPGGGAGLIGECAVEMPDGESRAPLIEHAVCSVLWE